MCLYFVCVYKAKYLIFSCVQSSHHPLFIFTSTWDNSMSNAPIFIVFQRITSMYITHQILYHIMSLWHRFRLHIIGFCLGVVKIFRDEKDYIAILSWLLSSVNKRNKRYERDRWIGLFKMLHKKYSLKTVYNL